MLHIRQPQIKTHTLNITVIIIFLLKDNFDKVSSECILKFYIRAFVKAIIYGVCCSGHIVALTVLKSTAWAEYINYSSVTNHIIKKIILKDIAQLARYRLEPKRFQEQYFY